MKSVLDRLLLVSVVFRVEGYGLWAKELKF